MEWMSSWFFSIEMFVKMALIFKTQLTAVCNRINPRSHSPCSVSCVSFLTIPTNLVLCFGLLQVSYEAFIVFLDLPAPWDAVVFAKEALRASVILLCVSLLKLIFP